MRVPAVLRILPGQFSAAQFGLELRDPLFIPTRVTSYLPPEIVRHRAEPPALMHAVVPPSESDESVARSAEPRNRSAGTRVALSSGQLKHARAGSWRNRCPQRR